MSVPSKESFSLCTVLRKAPTAACKIETPRASHCFAQWEVICSPAQLDLHKAIRKEWERKRSKARGSPWWQHCWLRCPGEWGSQTVTLRVSHKIGQKSPIQVSGMSSEICLLGLLKKLQAMFKSHPTQLVMKTGDLSAEEEEQQGAPIDKRVWIIVGSWAST